jgi:hypothetical protein
MTSQTQRAVETSQQFNQSKISKFQQLALKKAQQAGVLTNSEKNIVLENITNFNQNFNQNQNNINLNLSENKFEIRPFESNRSISGCEGCTGGRGCCSSFNKLDIKAYLAASAAAPEIFLNPDISNLQLRQKLIQEYKEKLEKEIKLSEEKIALKATDLLFGQASSQKENTTDKKEKDASGSNLSQSIQTILDNKKQVSNSIKQSFAQTLEQTSYFNSSTAPHSKIILTKQQIDLLNSIKQANLILKQQVQSFSNGQDFSFSISPEQKQNLIKNISNLNRLILKLEKIYLEQQRSNNSLDPKLKTIILSSLNKKIHQYKDLLANLKEKLANLKTKNKSKKDPQPNSNKTLGPAKNNKQNQNLNQNNQNNKNNQINKNNKKDKTKNTTDPNTKSKVQSKVSDQKTKASKKDKQQMDLKSNLKSKKAKSVNSSILNSKQKNKLNKLNTKLNISKDYNQALLRILDILPNGDEKKKIKLAKKIQEFLKTKKLTTKQRLFLLKILEILKFENLDSKKIKKLKLILKFLKTLQINSWA